MKAEKELISSSDTRQNDAQKPIYPLATLRVRSRSFDFFFN